MTRHRGWLRRLVPRLLPPILLLTSCAAVSRGQRAYTVEIYAALARQEEAAQALFVAAEAARLAGNHEACVKYATPALLIEQYAANQAHRALYLAGLEEADPGEPQPGRTPDAVCGNAGGTL